MTSPNYDCRHTNASYARPCDRCPEPNLCRAEAAERRLEAALLDPAPTDQGEEGRDFQRRMEKAHFLDAPPRKFPTDQGAEGPEPRSELRRKAAMSGTCPICGSEIPRSYTETTEGLVRVELTREEAEAFWNDLCFVDPDSKEDVAPECWSAWQKVRAGWGSKARAALADEGEQA